MLQALVNAARGWLGELRELLRRRRPTTRETRDEPPTPPRRYLPLERVVLTDGVGRTLFDQYAAHRAGAKGDEETGWVLLGVREEKEAVVLAALPAGAESDAGVAHVQFNSSAQVVGSRIVRQCDRRLTIVGVAHTHPGSLRHPSDADFRGDSLWVRQLRGAEGVFAIGTADADGKGDGREGRAAGPPAEVARQPKPHVQELGKLRLTWYSLRHGEPRYRPMPVSWTLGPDLARPLHPIWATIEAQADRLDRIARQQAGVKFDVVQGARGPALAITVPLAEPGGSVRVLVEGEEAHWYVVRGEQLFSVQPPEARLDQGLYLLLAELAVNQ